MESSTVDQKARSTLSSSRRKHEPHHPPGLALHAGEIASGSSEAGNPAPPFPHSRHARHDHPESTRIESASGFASFPDPTAPAVASHGNKTITPAIMDNRPSVNHDQSPPPPLPRERRFGSPGNTTVPNSGLQPDRLPDDAMVHASFGRGSRHRSSNRPIHPTFTPRAHCPAILPRVLSRK